MDIASTSSKAPEATILIVDDTLPSLRLLANILVGQGYHVQEAANGSVALELVASKPPDLILLDIMMAEMDGFEVCAKLKEKPSTRDIPVIFMSGLHEALDKVKAFTVGGVDYISKPFEIEEVVARITTHLTLRRLQKQLEIQNTLLQQEIRERKKIEEMQQDAETELRALLTALNDLIVYIDKDGGHLRVISTSSKFSSCQAAKLAGRTLFDVFSETQANLILTRIRQSLATKQTLNVEYSLEIEGQTTWFDGRIIPLSAEVVIFVARDITERKEAEEQLRKLSRAVEQSPSVIVITNLQGEIEFVNPAFTKKTGYTPEEAMGNNPRVLKSGHHPVEVYRDLWNAISKGQVWQGELLNRKKDGELFWEYATISPVKDQDGTATHYLAIKEDITKRKQAEESVKKANQELQQSVAEMTTLNFIAQTVNTVTDLQSALKIVASTMTKLFQARSTGIALLKPEKTELTVVAYASSVYNEPSGLGLIIPVIGNPSSEYVVNTGKSLIINDPQTNPLTVQIHALMRERDTCALLIVPLLARGEVIGTIGIDTGRERKGFAPAEAKLAETIAGQIAGAIEVARLFEHQQKMNQDLKAVYGRLQAELNFARKIQENLLPLPRPVFKGLDVICYSAQAREVGGDLYAYQEIQQEEQNILNAPHSPLPTRPTFALAVGDVSGKGMPAALLMAVSVTLFRSAVNQSLGPSALLASLDQAIELYTTSSMMNCALCCVEITLPPPGGIQESILRIANSGCIPPLIKRVTGAVEWPEVGGPPLGCGFGIILGYPQLDLSLAKGDMVILTSDGVVEAKNAERQLFGFERLEKAVASGPTTNAQAMLEHLKAEIADFVCGAEPHDDVTMVIGRIE